MTRSSLKVKLSYIFATGFGSGFIPFAPGTAGSLFALPIAWFIPDQWLIGLIILFAIIGWPAAAIVERHESKDPGIVVIDEMVGQWLALFFIPRQFEYYLISFILFRIFDIFKPFPANRSQDIGGGTGIMLDDIIAAAYAQLAFRLIIYLFF